MKRGKPILLLFFCMILITGIIAPNPVRATSNFTLKIGFADDYTTEQGHVEYQINGGSWENVTSATDLNITEEVTSLKFKVVPAKYYEVNFDGGPYLADGTGVAFNAGGADAAREALTGNGYEANLTDGLVAVSLTGVAFREGISENQANISVSIVGPGLEFWDDAIPSRITFSLGNGKVFQFGANNLVWQNGIAPPNATGVSTANPVPYSYAYDGSGFVSMECQISNASTKITSFKINGTDYVARFPQTDPQILECVRGGRWMETVRIDNIPHAANYNIEITAEPHDLMGGFGWNYLFEADAGESADRITHGTLTFVKGEYADVTYDSATKWNAGAYHGVGAVFEWKDGVKNYRNPGDAWGSAAFPKGAKITMKLIPDEGYQLVSLYGDENIEPQEEPGVYTITMKGGMNSHLQAEFAATDDIVDAKAGGVMSASVENLVNGHGEGTMVLSVDDTELSADSQAGFKQRADEENAEVQEVFDINLNNAIYKATSNADDTWLRPVSELTSPVNITLKLKDDYSDKGEVIVIHEHEGRYETIDVTYNAKENTVTFPADSFSNYALATIPEEEQDGPGDDDKKDEPAEEEQDYHLVSDDGNLTLDFRDKKDESLRLMAENLWGITDSKKLEGMDLTKEEYEKLTAMLAGELKKYGDVLAVYQIWLENKDGEYSGGAPYTLKIKLTEELKKYKDLKLVDVAAFGGDGLSPEDVIELTAEGDYLVATIDSLGQYALTGNSDVPKNAASTSGVARARSPQTGDESNLLFFFTLACTALLLMLLMRKNEG